MVGVALMLVQVRLLGVGSVANVASVRLLLRVRSDVVVESEEIEADRFTVISRLLVWVLTNNHSVKLVFMIVLLEIKENEMRAFRDSVLVAKQLCVEILAVNHDGSLVGINFALLQKILGEILFSPSVHDASDEGQIPLGPFEWIGDLVDGLQELLEMDSVGLDVLFNH